MKKTEDSDAYSEMEHKHGNPVVSFDYVHFHNFIIYVTPQSIKITRYPAAKHLKHNMLKVSRIRENY